MFSVEQNINSSFAVVLEYKDVLCVDKYEICWTLHIVDPSQIEQH